MAGNLMRYSGLLTKTRAMRGKLLSLKDLERIMELATVNEAIQYLKGTGGYGDIYQSHDGVWHRGQAEAVIIESLYRDFEKLFRFSDSEQRQAIRFVLFRYEVNLLKGYTKRLLHGTGEDTVEYGDDFFKKHAGFPLEQVRTAQSIGELEQCLMGTIYEPLVENFRQMNGKGAADFEYAMQTEIFYYSTVYQSVRHMKPSNIRSVLTELYGTQIDWLNIMWIYRSKRFYEQTRGELLSTLIPHQYRLKKSEVLDLVGAVDLTEMNKILVNTSYFKGKEAFVKMEDEISYRSIMKQVYQRVSRKYPVSMAPVLKYLHEKELEIERLTTIIEGIRYQVPPKDIRDIVLITN